MAQYTQKRIAGLTDDRWMRLSTMSALIGGGLMALVAVALHSVLNEAQFAVVDPLGAIAMTLLALGLPALYLRERHWFGTLVKVSFGFMSIGWIAATIGLIVASVTMPPVSETGFGVGLLGLLLAMIGAFAFGVAMLRTDAVAVPQLGAWLLVAALPIGLPFTILFTGYVMGEFADPWAGPLLLYGLAWVVFANYLRIHRMDGPADAAIPQ